MHTRGAILLANTLAGLGLGYTVTNIGFGDYAQLNRMFTFQDVRMFLAFVGATVIIVVIFAWTNGRYLHLDRGSCGL